MDCTYIVKSYTVNAVFPAKQDLFWRPEDDEETEGINSGAEAIGKVQLQLGWDTDFDEILESKLADNSFPYTTSGSVFKENHPLMWMVREQRGVIFTINKRKLLGVEGNVLFT